MALRISYDVLVDSIAVLQGDYSNIRKQAAMILLKIVFPPEALKMLFNEDGIHPFSRNDPRVRQWTKEVISKGACEYCGATEHLEAHHFVRWADFPPGRIDVNNGVCLCHECHCEEHKDEHVYNLMKSKA